MQKRVLYFITIALLLFGANFFVSKIQSQTKPFTMGQILRAIASINQETGNQKKNISDRVLRDVQQRGVDFALTKENEKLLRDEGASNEFIEAIRQKSPDPALVFLESGDAHYRKDEYDLAIKDYNKTIELRDDYDLAYCKRGLAYRGKDDFDQAIKDFTKAIELKPDNAENYQERGFIYYLKRDYDRAMKDYTKVIELKPDYTEAYTYRANIYNFRNEYDNAT